ncbi:MAG TPA: MBL fold metallo-hydrolase [Desulfomonilaceae bacterium]|nr:MBL fold metallo-hydrolase [Desulfomonilaceae bacterium]
MDIAGDFPRLLTEGLWVVGDYFFNLYLVKGEQASALIETGVSAMVDDAIGQIDSLGVNPTFIVVTHPHADHITGLAALKEKFPHALVIAAEGAPEFLSHPKGVQSMLSEDRHMSEFLAAYAMSTGRPPIEEPPSLANCLLAKDGDAMDLGGLTLRFLTATGHSPGTIVVHVPEIDALMLADSLGFRFPGRRIFPLFFTGFSEYLATLDRLAALNPAILGVPHQGPVLSPEVKQVFAESRQVAMDLRKRIAEDDRDSAEITNDLFNDFYRDECTMYTPENIMNCCSLLVKRAKDSDAAS